MAPDDRGPAVTAHASARFLHGELSATGNRRFLLNDPLHRGEEPRRVTKESGEHVGSTSFDGNIRNKIPKNDCNRC